MNKGKKVFKKKLEKMSIEKNEQKWRKMEIKLKQALEESEREIKRKEIKKRMVRRRVHEEEEGEKGKVRK